MTESEFLRATPRKLFKLADIHNELNNPGSSKKKEKEKGACYIDQLSL